MNDTEMNVCPFCGGPAQMLEAPERVRLWIECTVCGAKTREVFRVSEARQLWNQRQQPELPKALLYDPPEDVKRNWETAEIKADDQQDDTLLKLNMMLYVNGSPVAFRCGCGSNVFSHYREPDGREYYECHGCWTIYRGEKDGA